MRTVKDIQDELFMLQDKIKWAEMFISHARDHLHTLQEHIFDEEENEWLERLSKEGNKI
jgi:hypothetical protein